jgi:hypothetical protein
MTLAESLTARYKLIWDDGRVSRGAMERRAIEREPERSWRARAAASFDPDAIDVLGPRDSRRRHARRGRRAIAAGGVEAFVPRLAAISERVARHGIRTWSGRCTPREAARVVTSAGWTSRAGHVRRMERDAGRRARRRARRAGARADADLESRLDHSSPSSLALRAGGSAPRRRPPVSFHPTSSTTTSLGVLLHNLDGAQVAHGTGRVPKEQFGARRRCFGDDLTCAPTRASRWPRERTGSARRASRASVRVRGAGRLSTPLLDLKYAPALGWPDRPTRRDGHALPRGPAVDLYDDALDRLGRALVLSRSWRAHAGLHERRLLARPPRRPAHRPVGLAGRLRATISGNVFELLRSPSSRSCGFPASTHRAARPLPARRRVAPGALRPLTLLRRIATKCRRYPTIPR